MTNMIIGFFKKNYYLLTSVLFFLSWPSFDIALLKAFPFFAWIFAVPIFVYARSASLKDLFIKSFITSLIGNTLAYNWIGHFGANMAGGYFIVLGFLMTYMSIFFALKILMAEFLSRGNERLRIVIYPSVWILFDWINSLGLLTFPWAYMGYSQYPFTAMVQIVSVTGILGLNFIIMLFNYSLSELVHARLSGANIKKIFSGFAGKRFYAVAGVVAAALIFGAVRLYTAPVAQERDLRVAMAQSCISPWKSWSINRYRYLEELIRFTDASLPDDPDFIIWSESATIETISYGYSKNLNTPFQKEILDYVKSIGKPLFTGEIGVKETIENRRFKRLPQNNGVLINSAGEVVKTYSKMILVPFGEWFPYQKWFSGLNDLLERFGASNFVPGNTTEIFEVKGRRFGALICYEGLFHRLCNKYGKAGVDFFINITNDGWTDKYDGHMQHFAVSVFRAVENGVWYVRAGNTGYTAIIDPFGRITKSIPILKQGHLTGDLDFRLNRRTLFALYGDLFFYVVLLFVIGVSAKSVYIVIRNKKSRASLKDMI